MTSMNSGARRFATRTFLLCVAIAYGLAAQAQTAKPSMALAPQYRITGTLVSSADSSPVPHGHLTATLAGTGRRAGQHFPAAGDGSNEADTDGRGRFSMMLPSAGTWDVVAAAHGFTRQSFQQHEQFSTAVVLTRAEPTMNIQFALSPEAEIDGVVVDEAGEPVRGAILSLMRVRAVVPDRSEPATAMRSIAATDDRGMYEFDGLPPGNYRLCVQAQPWYAVAAGRYRQNADAPALDPSLDVAYPVTWFPGSVDPDAAETLTLHSGDIRQADFHLLPVPAIHLLIAPAPTSGPDHGMQFPIIQRADSGAGYTPFVQPTLTRNAQGQIDIGGLTPGLYQVRLAGPDGENSVSTIRVTAGSAQTLDFDAPADEAEISLHVDGLPTGEADSVQINLLDPDSRNVVASSDSGFRGRVRLRRSLATAAEKAPVPVDAQDEKKSDHLIQVPPGRYEVVIQGRPDLYLTGIAARGAQATGRVITVPAGASSLTLHIAEGRATLTGIARANGKPLAGAMVMLAPATLGDTGAIQIVRRDQSNTDGSFNIAEVIPGQYILIAVQDGWEINWKDAATLQRYLIGGVAVDLAGGGEVKQDVVAQRP